MIGSHVRQVNVQDMNSLEEINICRLCMFVLSSFVHPVFPFSYVHDCYSRPNLNGRLFQLWLPLLPCCRLPSFLPRCVEFSKLTIKSCFKKKLVSVMKVGCGI